MSKVEYEAIQGRKRFAILFGNLPISEQEKWMNAFYLFAYFNLDYPVDFDLELLVEYHKEVIAIYDSFPSDN